MNRSLTRVPWAQHNRGPFTVVGGDTSDDNNATLHSEPTFPAHMFSPAARDLVRGLLTKDPAKRLGHRGADEIMVSGVDQP